MLRNEKEQAADNDQSGRTAASHRREHLQYLREMLAQLRHMANVESLDMLTYLIEMAHMEASDLLAKGDDRDDAA